MWHKIVGLTLFSCSPTFFHKRKFLICFIVSLAYHIVDHCIIGQLCKSIIYTYHARLNIIHFAQNGWVTESWLLGHIKKYSPWYVIEHYKSINSGIIYSSILTCIILIFLVGEKKKNHTPSALSTSYQPGTKRLDQR